MPQLDHSGQWTAQADHPSQAAEVRAAWQEMIEGLKGDTSPSLLCFLSCSIMFIMPFMSFMNFMWPKPEPGAVMCGWNDMSEGRILKFGDDAPTVGEEELTAR